MSGNGPESIQSPGITPTILIIDDDEQVSDVLSLVLESEGYSIRSCANPREAFQAIRAESFSLMLLDLRLGEVDGLDLLPRLRDLAPNVPIFMITAHGDVDSAVRAFRLGASGYIKKPFEDGELRSQIREAVNNFQLRRRIQEIEEKGGVQERSLDPRSIIRTHDPAMDQIIRKVATASQYSSNVVITGESGSGKEVVARALHQCGVRRAGPFIAFNCAALPESLLESELFGYARGAFTDARENKPGLFARAHGGTLFLDEIGDAPLSIQTKLLRVLQEREVLPLGATTPIRVDVRVVAATHKRLEEEVAAGRFRQDLYYRLHVVPIRLPALRDRPRDIQLLGTLFATRISSEMGIPFDGFTPGAQKAMGEHDWPGNVRELQNRVEHALAMGGGGWVSARALFPERSMDEFPAESEIAPAGPFEQEAGAKEPVIPSALPTFCEAKNSFERGYLEQILSVAKGNIAKAARLASKSRTEVYNLLRKHSLDPDVYKQG